MLWRKAPQILISFILLFPTKKIFEKKVPKVDRKRSIPNQTNKQQIYHCYTGFITLVRLINSKYNVKRGVTSLAQHIRVCLAGYRWKTPSKIERKMPEISPPFIRRILKKWSQQKEFSLFYPNRFIPVVVSEEKEKRSLASVNCDWTSFSSHLVSISIQRGTLQYVSEKTTLTNRFQLSAALNLSTCIWPSVFDLYLPPVFDHLCID